MLGLRAYATSRRGDGGRRARRRSARRSGCGPIPAGGRARPAPLLRRGPRLVEALHESLRRQPHQDIVIRITELFRTRAAHRAGIGDADPRDKAGRRNSHACDTRGRAPLPAARTSGAVGCASGASVSAGQDSRPNGRGRARPRSVRSAVLSQRHGRSRRGTATAPTAHSPRSAASTFGTVSFGADVHQSEHRRLPPAQGVSKTRDQLTAIPRERDPTARLARSRDA